MPDSSRQRAFALEIVQTYRETPEQSRPPEFLRVAKLAQSYLATLPETSK